MAYRDFNNIIVSNYLGVSKVGDDTLILAKLAGRIRAKRVLDMGTGTGFIAIYLASLGRDVEGVDILTSSIDVAVKNAQKNKLKIRFYQSDLFSNVEGTYDLIVFNPPVGTATTPATTILIEKIKSVIPRIALFAKIYMFIFGNQRKKLVERFLKEARAHLKQKGTIIMFLYKTEVDLLSELNYTYRLLEEAYILTRSATA